MMRSRGNLHATTFFLHNIPAACPLLDGLQGMQ